MSIESKKFNSKLRQDHYAQLISDGESIGVKFAELRYKELKTNKVSISGVEELRIRMGGYSDTGAGISANWLKDGELIFNADNRNICWGYLPLTESNKDFLMYAFVEDKMFIVDEVIREEMKERAIKNGVPITPARTYISSNSGDFSEGERVEHEAEKENIALKTELDALKAEVAAGKDKLKGVKPKARIADKKEKKPMTEEQKEAHREKIKAGIAASKAKKEEEAKNAEQK